MSAVDVLLKPEECAMLLIDFQAVLGFSVESIPRQAVLNNAVALARTGVNYSGVTEQYAESLKRNTALRLDEAERVGTGRSLLLQESGLRSGSSGSVTYGRMID